MDGRILEVIKKHCIQLTYLADVIGCSESVLRYHLSPDNKKTAIATARHRYFESKIKKALMDHSVDIISKLAD